MHSIALYYNLRCLLLINSNNRIGINTDPSKVTYHHHYNFPVESHARWNVDGKLRDNSGFTTESRLK